MHTAHRNPEGFLAIGETGALARFSADTKSKRTMMAAAAVTIVAAALVLGKPNAPYKTCSTVDGPSTPRVELNVVFGFHLSRM